MVRDSMYVVDEHAVAGAILIRAAMREMLPGTTFRSEMRAPVVRSFRRDAAARSFRLCSSPRLHHVSH